MGKCKILAQPQELFGFLFNKFKNPVHSPPEVLPAQPGLALAAPDDYVGVAPPAALVEEETEGKVEYYSPHQSAEEEESNVSTETPSAARSLNEQTGSSNASFSTLKAKPNFCLPSQSEANPSAQYTYIYRYNQICLPH